MNKILNKIYIKLNKLIVRVIKNIFLLFPIKKQKIVFSNFYGRGYGDNPKYISEEIIRQKLPFDIVWLINNKNEEFPNNIRTVKYGSIRAMYELATAKVWIDNVRATVRPKKRKKQIYLQTWHSAGGVKKLEAENEEILPNEYIKSAKLDGSICDAILSSSWSQYEKMRKYFWLNENTEILKYGSPRNDILFNYNYKILMKNKIRKKYNISKLNNVILYMPTFRDNGSQEGYGIQLDKVLEAFRYRFNENFIVLVRFHPNVEKLSNIIKYNDKIINVTHYEDVQELYTIADFLISDYSSAPFDFTLLKKPVFLCTLDKKNYVRGLSSIFDRLPFSISETNEELIYNIKTFEEDKYWNDIEKFMKTEWISYDEGNAAFKTVKWIKEKINEEEK